MPAVANYADFDQRGTLVGSADTGTNCVVCSCYCVCSRFFQKICQHHGKAGGVSKTLLNVVKTHIGTENNAV